MTDKLIMAQIGDSLAAVTGVKRELRGSDVIREDLGIDSLVLLELLNQLEDKFGVDLIEDPKLLDTTTVDDLVTLLADSPPEPA